MPRYSIKSLSVLTGLPSDTIRNWEKRYRFLTPERGPKGTRVYTEKDVKLLKKVRELLMLGQKIGYIADLIQDGRLSVESQTSSSRLSTETEVLIKDFYQALISFDIDRARFLDSVLRTSLSLPQWIEFVAEFCLSSLGQDWKEKLIGSAEEHFISSYLRSRLLEILYLPVYHSTKSYRVVLFSTLPGERHEGGALIIASYIKLKGIPVVFLSSDLPLEETERFAKNINASLICLSLTDSFLIHDAREALRRTKTPICIGGAGIMALENDLDLPGHIHIIRESGVTASEEVVRINSLYSKSQRSH